MFSSKTTTYTVTRLFFASWQISRFSVSKISRLEIFAHWGYLNFASFLACYRNIIQYLIKVQKRVIKHVFWGRSNQCPVSKINAVNWLTTVWHELSIALHRSVCRKCCSNRDEHNALTRFYFGVGGSLFFLLTYLNNFCFICQWGWNIFFELEQPN